MGNRIEHDTEYAKEGISLQEDFILEVESYKQEVASWVDSIKGMEFQGINDTIKVFEELEDMINIRMVNNLEILKEKLEILDEAMIEVDEEISEKEK